MVPTGAGETCTLEPGPVVRYSRAVWEPTGRRVVFSGFDGHDLERIYLQDARWARAVGRARPWNRLGRSTPSGLQGQYRILVTPDGESYACSFGRRTSELYATSPLQ